MKSFAFACFILAAGALAAESAPYPIPYATITAPVVHDGAFHVLACGKTWVVLDGSRGMSVHAIGINPEENLPLDTDRAVLSEAGIKATIRSSSGEIELDQAYDPAPKLVIIDQGPGRVAARAFFAMRSRDGLPHGNGTLDIYVYSDRVFLAPSLQLDDEPGGTVVSVSGFRGTVPGDGAEIMARGSKLLAREQSRFLPFGEEKAGFSVLVDNPGRASMKMGWMRNSYPGWMYLNEVDANPERDELYEKWPLWIAQRGAPFSWTRSSKSGLMVGYAGSTVRRLDFQWLAGDSLRIPEGGYTTFNGVMGVFLGKFAARAEERWEAYSGPAKPAVKGGEFRYYNEVEGVYEIDTKGGDCEAVFDNTAGTADRSVFVRFWNLKGTGAYEALAGREPLPLGLYNEGDLIEDPMVPMLKDTTGPARFAGVDVPVPKGSKTTVSLKRKPGMQFTYQMYSALETYEAWSDSSATGPLFRFHATSGEIYNATLPGKDAPAFAKLPLYWVKNGVNNDTFMNHTRGFRILGGDPSMISFVYTGTNLEGTGLSVYTTTARLTAGRLAFDVNAEFTPLDNGRRWTSVEYCDLYPFDNVYRRTFHYRDVVFLTSKGVFDRVGTGAWSGRFKTIAEPGGLGYYSEAVAREKGVSRTPASDDGTVWILGNSPERGNILYRRGAWMTSAGARSVFSLCNAWVDIHNTVVGRIDPSSKETIAYSVEIFPGAVPLPADLTAFYAKAAGGTAVKRITGVKYDARGSIVGFATE